MRRALDRQRLWILIVQREEHAHGGILNRRGRGFRKRAPFVIRQPKQLAGGGMVSPCRMRHFSRSSAQMGSGLYFECMGVLGRAVLEKTISEQSPGIGAQENV